MAAVRRLQRPALRGPKRAFQVPASLSRFAFALGRGFGLLRRRLLRRPTELFENRFQSADDFAWLDLRLPEFELEAEQLRRRLVAIRIGLGPSDRGFLLRGGYFPHFLA